MGDWFQTIVDVEVGAEDAEHFAAEVRDWLISAGIVLSERTDCVLGAQVGHPPGPAAGQALEDPSEDDGWQRLWTKGLDITVGRAVFDAGQGEVEAVTCPHCAKELRLVDACWQLIDEAWAPFREVLTDWPEGLDGVIACRFCERPVEPTAWLWADDHLALGQLGFTFWNWPSLKQDFVDEIGRRLGGHRTALLAGKL
ncbi:hypothetical protein [Saccharopolyspora mangrovi]|uniref:Uncharacterized protein n=1 Tax=Saccharopolyspora mangrovi TaxID=3082379 RepID=A0ABU6A816_9PSEU|nr:hypothetical protein [Saccharopolyspora sp. S2-29]MEB3367529.1 hypothetical protein [Saccharopolyspora sp. S2-29]